MTLHRRFAMLILLTAAIGLLGIPSSRVLSTTPTPQPSLTATPDADVAPLKFPVPAPTKKQIDEARKCDLRAMADKLYPSVSVNDPLAKFKANTACEWAALAVAYVRTRDNSDPMPVHGEEALLKALEMNPALAFSIDVIYGYYNGFSLVELPSIAKQPVTKAEITLNWGGGLEVYIDEIKYTIRITNANTDKPVVSGTLKTNRNKAYLHDDTPKVANDGAIKGTLSKELIQALGSSLTDLMPVTNYVSWVPCTDNYPDWTMHLTFADGKVLDLVTKGSNLYFTGAPWQTTINKQKYVQFSAATLRAVSDIADALNLPSGSTQGMYCGGLDNPFKDAYN
jgi:hypothetical protein